MMAWMKVPATRPTQARAASPSRASTSAPKRLVQWLPMPDKVPAVSRVSGSVRPSPSPQTRRPRRVQPGSRRTRYQAA